MIPTNLTKTKIEYYKIAKKLDINMISCKDNEIEIAEKSYSKGLKFNEAIREINKNCRVIDILAMGMGTDVRGNTLEGCKALYQVDDNYYKRLVGEMQEHQLSLF